MNIFLFVHLHLLIGERQDIVFVNAPKIRCAVINIVLALSQIEVSNRNGNHFLDH